jgi:peptidoglycan-associated lipoprotein
MRRYDSLFTIPVCAVLAGVLTGCVNPPPADVPSVRDIPVQTNDSVRVTPVGTGTDPIPPVPPIPPLPDDRQQLPEGARLTNAVFPAVMFEFDSFRITSSELPKIKQVAEFMRKNATVKLVTEGHCDERGSNEYNMSLGEHRAQTVRACLVSLGIEAGRIQTRSFGEEKPSDPNHNEQAWRKNRRAEFALFR